MHVKQPDQKRNDAQDSGSSDKHPMVVVGPLDRFLACADKHRRGLAGGGGVWWD